VRNLELNAAAVELELPPADLERLTEVFTIGAGAGERYNPRMMEKWGMSP
jgi:hypothetical protein